jgi:MFS family permease
MTLLLLAHLFIKSGLVFIPGLFLIGAGIGIMLTASVNVVQSSFPEKDQGQISGVSRSVSNLGSSLGTALVGSVLVTTLIPPDKTFGLALITVIIIGIIGFIVSLFIPNREITPST